MRSLFTKILLWCFAALVFCLAGSTFTAKLRHFAPQHRDFFSRFLTFQLKSARFVYESDGKDGLAQYFARLKETFPGEYVLLDRQGRDLLTGADRRVELQSFAVPRHWRVGHDPVQVSLSSPDGKYALLVNSVFPAGPPNPIPYYLWIVVSAIVFCSILAFHIGSPLRALEQTVEKFGRGDLDIRVSSRGADDFAKLSRTFNLMADRIQLLLTAERRLLQDVSHELRSPLARLKFATELARTSQNRDKSIDRIQKEVDRLTCLVSELLQVTRAESDPDSRTLYEISLADLVDDVVSDATVEYEARCCHVSVSLDEDVILLGDRELLRRAFENILRNAIRYAPKGTSIDVTLERRPNEGVVRLRDYGPGVPEYALDSLFKPFFRVEADRSRNGGGGFGLGLSIAQRAVAVHSGRISAFNADPGLCVEIVLPTMKRSKPKLANRERMSV
jgi:signal transduction histidine kinase